MTFFKNLLVTRTFTLCVLLYSNVQHCAETCGGCVLAGSSREEPWCCEKAVRDTSAA